MTNRVCTMRRQPFRQVLCDQHLQLFLELDDCPVLIVDYTRASLKPCRECRLASRAPAQAIAPAQAALL